MLRALRSAAALALLAAAVLAAPAAAQSDQGRLPDALSTHGLPGLINTPSAMAVPSGTFRFNVNSMPDYQLLGDPVRGDFAWQGNVQLAIGFWDRLTIGGRGTEMRLDSALSRQLIFYPGGGLTVAERNYVVRDLAANVSLLAVREGRWMPAISVGVQDLGGAANNFEGRFAVASKTIGDWARISAGYGIGEDVLDGAFGGIEVAPLPGLGLVAEYDTERFNAGARWRMLPTSWAARGLPQLTASAFWTEDRDPSVSLDLSMPLDPGRRQRPSEERRSGPAEITDPVARALVGLGFENVAVETAGATIRVEYENRVYNQSELDGVAAALRAIEAHAPPAVADIELVLTSIDVPITEVRLARTALRDGVPDPSALDVGWPTAPRLTGPRWNPARSNLDLELIPSVQYIAFSEASVFEGRFNLTPTLRAQPFRGITLEAAPRIAIYQTDRYRPVRGPRPDPELERATVSWLHRVPGIRGWGAWSEWTAGQLELDELGARHQAAFVSPGGRVRLGTDIALLGPEASEVDRLYAVASVATLIPEIESIVTLSAGQYMDEDAGFTVDLSRWVGDTRVSMFMARTDISTQAGFRFSVPLSGRRDITPRAIRPRATSALRSGVQTTLFEEFNAIRGDTGRTLSSRTALPTLHLDFGRMGPGWSERYLGDERFWPGG